MFGELALIGPFNFPVYLLYFIDSNKVVRNLLESTFTSIFSAIKLADHSFTYPPGHSKCQNNEFNLVLLSCEPTIVTLGTNNLPITFQCALSHLITIGIQYLVVYYMMVTD